MESFIEKSDRGNIKISSYRIKNNNKLPIYSLVQFSIISRKYLRHQSILNLFLLLILHQWYKYAWLLQSINYAAAHQRWPETRSETNKAYPAKHLQQPASWPRIVRECGIPYHIHHAYVTHEWVIKRLVLSNIFYLIFFKGLRLEWSSVLTLPR